MSAEHSWIIQSELVQATKSNMWNSAFQVLPTPSTDVHQNRQRCISSKYKVTNALKFSGHYMYRQFNIQQFYVLPTQCIYVLCGSEIKQRLFPYTALTDWFV
jgi:hypothetical protein